MPAVQTAYTETMSAGRAGHVVNTEKANYISRTVENASGLPFGAPAFQGVADKGAILATAGATKFVGITVRERSVNPETGGDKFAQFDTARLLTEGVIWVVAGEAVTAGDPVYVTVADATYKKTVGTNVLIPNARFDTSGANGALVQVRLA